MTIGLGALALVIAGAVFILVQGGGSFSKGLESIADNSSGFDGMPSPKDVREARVISSDELSKSLGQGKYWLVLHGLVYDVSEYRKEHPGEALEGQMGFDCGGNFEDAR